MERNVVHVRPEQSVELCMALMSDNRVRHLPVLEGKKIIGIISIGDLLKSIISKQKFVIDELEHYIQRLAPIGVLARAAEPFAAMAIRRVPASQMNCGTMRRSSVMPSRQWMGGWPLRRLGVQDRRWQK
jgi:CBS domain-containing protein